MELEGTVTGGIIVPDEGIDAPDGTRVRFEAFQLPRETSVESDLPALSFAEAMAEFCGAAKNLPDDYALNHEHYRHGTPKR